MLSPPCSLPASFRITSGHLLSRDSGDVSQERECLGPLQNGVLLILVDKSVVGNQDVAINSWEKVHDYRLDLSLGLALMDGYFPVSSDSLPEHVPLMLTAQSSPGSTSTLMGTVILRGQISRYLKSSLHLSRWTSSLDYMLIMPFHRTLVQWNYIAVVRACADNLLCAKQSASP